MSMQSFNARLRAPWAVLPLVLALAACGGGGGGDDGDGGTAEPTTLSLSGVVAIGAALPGAAVSVSCAAGSGEATSGDDGAYSLQIENGSLPCVLTATGADESTVLHSVVPGSGALDGSAVANITPLTELLIAQLTGMDPAAFVAAFGTGTEISADKVADAWGDVTTMLSTAAGVDASMPDNFLTAELVAGSGEGYDHVLDELKAVLDRAGTSLEVVASLVASSSANGDTSNTGTTVLLDSGSAHCPSLKAGKHRVISPSDNETFVAIVDTVNETVQIDGETYELSSHGTCDFTLNDGENTRVLVARSGMAVWRTFEGTEGYAGVSMPEQSLSVAAVAGTYTRVSYGAEGSELDVGDFGSLTFDSAGVNTTSTDCTSIDACVEEAAPGGRLVVNADGGFDYKEGEVTYTRLFGFVNADGKPVLVGLDTDGSFHVLVRQQALTVPSLGDRNDFWQFTASAANGTGTLAEEGNVIVAVDGSQVKRQFVSDGHFDNLGYNTLFPGVRTRALNDCSSAGGDSFACNAVVQLPLQGNGITLSVSAVPGKHFMTVSVNQPAVAEASSSRRSRSAAR